MIYVNYRRTLADGAWPGTLANAISKNAHDFLNESTFSFMQAMRLIQPHLTSHSPKTTHVHRAACMSVQVVMMCLFESLTAPVSRLSALQRRAPACQMLTQMSSHAQIYTG